MTRTEFESLYTSLAPRLRSFIARQIGNPETAADLLQDTFLRLLRSPSVEVRTGQEITAYLYRTAHSVIVDHVRRERRARAWSFLMIRPSPAAPVRSSTSAFDQVFRSLTPRERTLLWLAYVEEMSHVEIAGIIDVGERSVKVLLFRARKRLAAGLKEKGFASEVFA